MKMKTACLIGIFLIGLSHAQDRAQLLQDSLTQVAKSLGMPKEKLKFGTPQEIAKTRDEIVKHVEGQKVQHARKTKAMKNLADVFTKHYLGFESKDMVSLSKEDIKVLWDRSAKIKADLDRIVILVQTIKDREDTIKEMHAGLDEKDTEIQRRDFQIKDLREKETNLKTKIRALQSAVRE